MRYEIRYLELIPTSHLKVFGKSNNLHDLKKLDYQSTQIIDTETNEIISNFGKKSKEYGNYERKRFNTLAKW